MKKPLSIILTIILIISIVGNITLYLQLNKVNSNNRGLNNSIVEIQDLISELENQLSDLQQQLSDSTAKNEELQENNDSLQSELEQLQSEVEFLKSIEPMSVTMYVLEDCDTYSEINETSEVVGDLTTNQEVHVTGQSKETGWYEIEINGSKQYVSDKYLSDTKMQVTNPSTTNNNNQNSTPNNNQNLTPASASFNTQPTIINGQTDASQLDWGETINWGQGDYSSGAGIHAE